MATRPDNYDSGECGKTTVFEQFGGILLCDNPSWKMIPFRRGFVCVSMCAMDWHACLELYRIAA